MLLFFYVLREADRWCGACGSSSGGCQAFYRDCLIFMRLSTISFFLGKQTVFPKRWDDPKTGPTPPYSRKRHRATKAVTRGRVAAIMGKRGIEFLFVRESVLLRQNLPQFGTFHGRGETKNRPSSLSNKESGTLLFPD